MSKQLEWLKEEVARWRADGLVDEALEQRILARYPPATERNWGRVIFSAIGVLVLAHGSAIGIARRPGAGDGPIWRGRMASQAFNASGVID